MKAITASIYENKMIGNCSNNGISSRFDRVLILCEDGYIDVDGTEENLCEVRYITFGGQTHMFAEPVAAPKGIGWMDGGSIVYTSDSRFPSDYPLRLHDRQETHKEYEMYSH